MVDTINESIINLWSQKPIKNNNILCPLIYPEQPKNSCLFVGINPSFNERGLRNILKGTKYFKNYNTEYFKWNNWDKSKVNDLACIEKIALNKYSYFSKPRRLSKYLGFKMSHVDLFFYREKAQKELRKILFDGKDNIELKAFDRKQLKLSYELIKSLEPQIIIVINALASRIFKKYFRPILDKDFCYYYLFINKKKTPIFFSSMLSGQRALDEFSYERLKWHIKYVLNKI